MADIGKCLLFYLKYPAEMERLYEDEAEEPNVEGLPNPEQILRKVRDVGDAASHEAAELLESCCRAIEQRFVGVGVLRRGRTDPKKDWGVRFRISVGNDKKKEFQIGVFIDSTESALVPWIWCGGGRRAEGALIEILSCGDKAVGLGEDWTAGHVRLARIKIPVPDRLDTPIEYDSLVAQVQQAFKPITAKNIKQIAAIASSS